MMHGSWLGISIHAPAKGATDNAKLFYKGTAFQSTLPRRERQEKQRRRDRVRNFNPRSREGSDKEIFLNFDEFGISIHAPAKGATQEGDAFNTKNIFQSTLPRRERRFSFVVCKIYYKNFNPRSREGSDSIY